MKHVLNRGDFGISLRFWVERFLHHKLVSLNNYKVDDRSGLSDVLGDILSGGRNSVARISELCRVARRIGLIGINCYSTPVCKFCDHCTGLGLERMEDIDSDCVVHFMSVHTSGLKDATVRNYHFVISNFLGFVSSNNGQDGYGHVYDFSVPVFLKRARGDLPEYLTEDEMCSFLRSLRSYSIQGRSSKFIMVRNQLIVLMILYSGARVSEVLGIRSKDVVLDGNFYSMRIRGKGNKVRVVFVHADSVRPYFDEYQLMRASVTCDENLPLFVSSKLKPVSQPYIYSVIEGLLFSSGIRKSKNGAHLLRHSFATLLYRKSKDLVLVQESLGHSSIETSRIYTHFDNDGLKQAANIVSDALDG